MTLIDIVPSLAKGGAEQGFAAPRQLSTIANKLPTPRSVWRKLQPNCDASKPADDRLPAPPAGKDCRRQVGSRSFQGDSFGCLIPMGDELAIVGVMEQAVNAQSAAANFWRKRSSVLERNLLMQRLSNPGSPDEGDRE